MSKVVGVVDLVVDAVRNVGLVVVVVLALYPQTEHWFVQEGLLVVVTSVVSKVAGQDVAMKKVENLVACLHHLVDQEAGRRIQVVKLAVLVNHQQIGHSSDELLLVLVIEIFLDVAVVKVLLVGAAG